jgi:hypothetical protein
MNGWLAVARMSCSVSARLIFLRWIISDFDSTSLGSVNAYKPPVTAVLTFHSEELIGLLLPHKIHPPNISFTQHFQLHKTRRTDFDLRREDGKKRQMDQLHRLLTDRTLIELLEYVLLNAALPGASEDPSLARGVELPLRPERVIRPRQELEESVSKESVPSFSPLTGGNGGSDSTGASMPFLVIVAEEEREPVLNRFFAFGAEATRRIKRVADAPMPIFGDAGEFDCDCWVGFEGEIVGKA